MKTVSSLKSQVSSIRSVIVLFIFSIASFTINAQVVQINQTFSSDTVITPFTASDPVYSLSMNGRITLNSDSSLVRVVLIDTWGNHYNDYTLPGALARNTLLGAGVIEYDEPIVLNDTNTFSPSGSAYFVTPDATTGNVSQAIVKVYPNPAHDYFIIDYTDNTSGLTGPYFVKIKDSEGSLFQQFNREKSMGQFLVRTSNIASGIYFIELWKDHNRIAFTKLILTK